MANTTLSVANLDYPGLQANLIEFLRGYPQFKDYDFAGSNLRTLIDLLAYNTYINSFYTNMAINEMFLDTALLRQSIISHAKDLNYLPRSARSAKAYIDIQVYPNDSPAFVSMPAGQKFQGTNGNSVFTFLTMSNTIISPFGGAYIAQKVELSEGVLITEKFIVNTTLQNQRFVISNKNIDTTTLKLTVTNELGITEEWKYYPSLFGVKDSTKAFFLQGNSDKYEIVFGDNVVGLYPPNGSTITITYINCNLDSPNGISKFKSASNIGGYGSYDIITSTTANGSVIVTSGGAPPESNSSIKFNAPRAYQTLERAVTANDYKNILLSEFTEISDVYVYGGDELTPPDYGKVYIAVDLFDIVGLSDFQKNKIQSFISTRAPISITPVVIAADYTFIALTSDISYDLNQTSQSESDIAGKVLQAITNYNNSNLTKFNTRFRYSQLLAAIDSADTTIVQNETNILLFKQLTPILNSNYSASLKYQNSINPETIISTAFTYNDLECTLKDDGQGNLKIISTIADVVTSLFTAGTIDYENGVINLTNFNISDYLGNYIAIYAQPTNNDNTSYQNIILEIDLNNVIINVEGIRA